MVSRLGDCYFPSDNLIWSNLLRTSQFGIERLKQVDATLKQSHSVS